nr:MAG: hypothetical protein DIU78_15180 [Pseudomonadota bacterium]
MVESLRRTIAASVVGSLLGGIALIACSSDTGSGASVIIAEPQCTLDLECPAGSHCGSQGKCISLCTPGADCGEGMVCTAQGRCVQKPPEDTVPPPPAATSMPPLGDIGTCPLYQPDATN